MIKKYSLSTLLVLTCLLLPYSLHAQSGPEKILLYNSQIEVHQDGSMTVTETIKVQSAGDQIKRGIYRDFPTRYKDNYGNRYTVEFQVIEVKRDDKPEPYHIENRSNGKRVYIGQQDIILSPGIYTYTLTYNTNRQLGFFKDHDELYWNVTGNDWGFVIDTASATVILPEGARNNITETDAYTGYQGEQGKNFTSAIDSAGNPTFITTRSLQPKEGLTIVVSWKKGFVTEPSAQVKFNYFIKDNSGVIFAFTGFILVLVYYLVIWSIVGKDPAPGTIIPQYYPPKDFTPAAIRYITNMKFDNKVFAATIINLAVKGYLTISEDSGVYTLTLKYNDTKGLLPDEQKIVTELFGSVNWVKLESINHNKISKALQTLKTYLHLNYEKNYFLTNYKYFAVGLAISIIIINLIAIPLAISKGGQAPFLLLFMSVWLSIWTMGVSFLVMQVYTNWKNVFFGSIHQLTSLFSALFFTAFSLPFIGGEIAGIYMFSTATAGWFVIFLLILVVLNYVFYHLLKAPTLIGRQVLDKIDGFKMFLTITEKDRLNVLNPVGRTPEVFERYLPYALALDVEQAWAEQFSDVLSRASADGREYSPSWYSGTIPFTAASAGTFASSFSSSFSNAIASSSTAPGTSSGGGGGGSSGGGGGGGGGGGW